MAKLSEKTFGARESVDRKTNPPIGVNPFVDVAHVASTRMCLALPVLLAIQRGDPVQNYSL